MSLSEFSYFFLLELFNSKWLRCMYLKLKTSFWSKSYVSEVTVKSFSAKAISKFQMSIWHGTNNKCNKILRKSLVLMF